MTYKCIGPKQFASGQKLTCIPFVFSAGCHAAPYVPLLLVGIQNLPNLLVENSVVPVKALGKVFVNGGLGDVEMLRRDLSRLSECRARITVMPLGSGALAGTTYPFDREYVAEKLGFSAVTNNSLDGVSDRDFAIEMASDLSLLMMHLSRFSEELILWSTHEFAFVEMDDAYSTGSSIMPQHPGCLKKSCRSGASCR